MRSVFAFFLALASITTLPVLTAEPETVRLSTVVASGEGYDVGGLGPHTALFGDRVAFAEATFERGHIAVADVRTGEILATLLHPLDTKIKWKQMALSIAMNERYIVSSGYTESYYPGSRRHGEILVFDAQTFEHLRTIRSPAEEWEFGFGEGPMQLDGGRVLVRPTNYRKPGQVSEPVFLFDLETGDLLWTLRDEKRRADFAGMFSMQGDHVALPSPDNANEVLLYHIGSDDGPVATFRSPETVEGAEFGGPLLLTENTLLVGGSVPSKVRVVLNHYASVGKLYAFGRDDGEVHYTITDPFPVQDGTVGAVYAAASGAGTPYYGSYFPGGLDSTATGFLTALPAYRNEGGPEGALMGFDIATGQRVFLLTPDDNASGANFAQLFDADGNRISIYHKVGAEDSKRDAVSVYEVK